MHMADALLSPAVGGGLWAVTGLAIARSARRVAEEGEDRSIPLMGVIGAFVFAAQMINFTIPGTGSSGHLGGGLLLAVLLGPHAGFLALASVLTVQALFFADGGLLALGANVFNLGAIPCFVAYPLFYRPVAGTAPGPGRTLGAGLLAAVLGLQLGSLGVVFQTVLSGISELPFSSFALLMQPIHLAIGVVEGVVTAAVINFVRHADPSILREGVPAKHSERVARHRVVLAFGLAAVLTAGGLAWFASERPDGLEWSIQGVADSEEIPGQGGRLHHFLGQVQEKVSFLPGYDFRSKGADAEADETSGAPSQAAPGTGVAGLVGAGTVVALILGIGWVLRRRASSMVGHRAG